MEKNKIIEHEEEIKEEEIKVSKSKLDEILARQDALEAQNKAKDIELEVLKKSVSTAKYNYEKEKLGKDTVPTVRFKLWEGVPIIAMKSLEQKLNRSPMTGAIVNESIRYMFKFANGEEKEIPYIDFCHIIDHAVAHVVARRTDHGFTMYDGKVHDHEEIFTCEFIDEELNKKYGQFDVSVSYVNL